MIFVSVFSLFLFISPFSFALVNYTFNKNLIPHDMKEFQQQTRDFTFTSPLTKRELEYMIANTESVIPNFETDSINDTAHRFEQLKATYEKKKAFAFAKKKKNILRNDDEPNKNAVKRAFDLMSQFVYAARYKLTYGQELRQRYKFTTEYKIGYCFALMRDIRQQQLSLYTTMHHNYAKHIKTIYTDPKIEQNLMKELGITEKEGEKRKESPFQSYVDFQSYFTMYEKIVKLDVDMKDVVALTQNLMDMRWIDPNSTSSTTLSHR